MKLKSTTKDPGNLPPRYDMANHGTGQHISGIGRAYERQSADIFEIRWLQDGPAHWSEYASEVARNVRQPEAKIICDALNQIAAEGELKYINTIASVMRFYRRFMSNRIRRMGFSQ